MTDFLATGSQFPELRLTMTDGSSMTLPADLSTPLTIVLFYRGHW